MCLSHTASAMLMTSQVKMMALTAVFWHLSVEFYQTRPWKKQLVTAGETDKTEKNQENVLIDRQQDRIQGVQTFAAKMSCQVLIYTLKRRQTDKKEKEETKKKIDN